MQKNFAMGNTQNLSDYNHFCICWIPISSQLGWSLGLERTQIGMNFNCPWLTLNEPKDLRFLLLQSPWFQRPRSLWSLSRKDPSTAIPLRTYRQITKTTHQRRGAYQWAQASLEEAAELPKGSRLRILHCKRVEQLHCKKGKRATRTTWWGK